MASVKIVLPTMKMYKHKKWQRLAAVIGFLCVFIVAEITFLTAFHHHEDLTHCTVCSQLHKTERTVSISSTLAVNCFLIFSILKIILLFSFLLQVPNPISLKNRLDN